MFREKLLALLDARSAALMARDIETLAALLDEDFRYVDSLGRCLVRHEYLESRRTGEVVILSQRVRDVHVRELGPNHVIVTAITEDEGTYQGKSFRAAYRVVHLCRMHEGSWRFTFGQSTTMDGK